MTKTLTEQWKDGKLEKGTYWCVSSWTDEIRMFYFEGDYFIDCDVPLDDDNIEQVLAPVPSYAEYKRLQERLEISTKALKEIAFEIGDLESDYGYHYELAQKALKEMEGVK